MTLYCDSSALVKLYVAEPHADTVRSLVDTASVVITAAISLAEIRASLHRAHREGRLSRQGADLARRQFLRDWPNIVSINVDPDLLSSAADLAERHNLRALDGIHLAAFQRVVEQSEDDVEFSGFDDRLNRAARKLG